MADKECGDFFLLLYQLSYPGSRQELDLNQRHRVFNVVSTAFGQNLKKYGVTRGEREKSG